MKIISKNLDWLTTAIPECHTISCLHLGNLSISWNSLFYLVAIHWRDLQMWRFVKIGNCMSIPPSTKDLYNPNIFNNLDTKDEIKLHPFTILFFLEDFWELRGSDGIARLRSYKVILNFLTLYKLKNPPQFWSGFFCKLLIINI